MDWEDLTTEVESLVGTRLDSLQSNLESQRSNLLKLIGSVQSFTDSLKSRLTSLSEENKELSRAQTARVIHKTEPVIKLAPSAAVKPKPAEKPKKLEEPNKEEIKSRLEEQKKKVEEAKKKKLEEDNKKKEELQRKREQDEAKKKLIMLQKKEEADKKKEEADRKKEEAKKKAEEMKEKKKAEEAERKLKADVAKKKVDEEKERKKQEIDKKGNAGEIKRKLKVEEVKKIEIAKKDTEIKVKCAVVKNTDEGKISKQTSKVDNIKTKTIEPEIIPAPSNLLLPPTEEPLIEKPPESNTNDLKFSSESEESKQLLQSFEAPLSVTSVERTSLQCKQPNIPKMSLEEIEIQLQDLKSSYSEEELTLDKTFDLSVGARSALSLLTQMEEEKFYLRSFPQSEVIWAFRLFFIFLNKELPLDENEAWEQCREFLIVARDKEKNKKTVDKFMIEKISQFDFSNGNIDKIESMVYDKDYLLQPQFYTEFCALTGLLMFAVREASIFGGAIKGKVPVWRQYKRLVYKQKQLETQILS